jgi:N-acetyl-1-D-myo-inositol-2-amino-2-deoxy-alpha-D-glucopyranoside deacetylase
VTAADEPPRWAHPETGHRLGLLCVQAHPDDEVTSSGGVLARYAVEGLRTAVVTCTGGEQGEIVGPDMDPDEVRPRLAQLRRAELADALGRLGAGEPRMLGYRDSGMAGTETNAEPSSFWRADFDEAVGRLVGHLREFRPDVVVTHDAYGGYGHPDHIQAHRVALVAAEASAHEQLYPESGPPWRVAKLYFATLSKSMIASTNAVMAERGLDPPFGEAVRAEDVPVGVPDEEITTTVDVRDAIEAKVAALRAHASQVPPDSFFFTLPQDLHEQAFGSESFILHRSDVPAPALEDDLFAGLRVGG